ncbi:MAG: 3-dehydroquinate synthase family protein, partial [bacterium]
GKVGVNHPLGKNMIGAFYQPRLVFTDLALLKTLAPEEFRAGFAEVIKHGVIRSHELFEFLEKNLDEIFALNPVALTRIVRDCCAIKARVVEEDERESGLRAILNFGHTLGHALESATNYEMLRHGEAIAIGMVAAAELAQRLSLLKAKDAARIASLISRSGLPIRFPVTDHAKLLGLVKKDKKVRDGKVRFVLPVKIGDVVIRDDVDSAFVEEIVAGMSD